MDAETPRPRPSTIRATIQIALHLTLISAVPLVLWHLAGDPIPAHLPTWTEIHAHYAGILQQPGQVINLLLHAGADVLWIAWACYSLATLGAFLWILTHPPNVRLPRCLAAITPALALRAFSLGALVTAPAITPIASASTTPTARAFALGPATHPTPGAAPRSESRSPYDAVHLVTRGDNLWDLAEHYYGDPAAWPRIFDANEGVNQADGRSLEEPDLIIPGWRLTIPGVSGSAANPHPDAGTGGTGPAATAARGPTAAATAPAAHPAPARPHTATTAPHTPATRPAAPNTRPPARPHTTGYALPRDAGYVGTTLLAAVATAVAILRTRNRRQGHPPDKDIPDLAQRLTAAHAAAQSAAAYGYRSDEHPGQQPPPLTTTPARAPVLATSSDAHSEIPFDTARQVGPLALTGLSAQDAARALAISTLATEGHALRADPQLANELFGSTNAASEQDPRAAEPPEPDSKAIRITSHGAEHEPNSIVLGDLSDKADATILDVSQNGTVRDATGPDADRYAGARIHTLNKESATDLYTTLKNAGPMATALAPASGADSDEPANPAWIARAHATTPLILRVLGEVDILTRASQSLRIGTEQATAILTLLALNPDGIPTRTLRALEWPGSSDERRTRLTLATAINRVRRPLRDLLADKQTVEPSEPVLHDRTRQTYRLNPHLLTTDLALTQQLTKHAGTETDHETALQALTDAAALHRGPLAEYLDDTNRDWLTTGRFNTLNDTVALHLHIANLAVLHTPQLAAGNLRTAVSLAPEDHDTVIAALRVARQMQDAKLASDLYGTYLRALKVVDEEPEPEATRLARSTNH